MNAPSKSQLKKHNITPANLSEKQLKFVLRSFSRAKKMSRVITGIHDMPGMLTHTISGSLYTNNVSDIRQKAALRLFIHGLKLVCIPQVKNNPLTQSHHWYLCHIGEIELFDVDVAANDEVF
jgi:hypothetical protein